MRRPITYEVNERGCHICTSHKRSNGYPAASGGRLHRRIYEEQVGPIPEGLLIRHTCDDKACINPAHLLTGTDADNARDRVEHRSFGPARASRRLPPREPLPEVLTLAQAAELLQVDETTLARAARRGEVPGRKIGRLWRFLRAELEAWLSGRAASPVGDG